LSPVLAEESYAQNRPVKPPRPAKNAPLVVNAIVGKPLVIHGQSASLAFSRDGTQLTSGIPFWSTVDGSQLVGSSTNARKGRPAFSQDGRYVANGLSILNARNEVAVTLLDPGFGKRKVNVMAFSPDGKTAAVGNGDRAAGDLKLFAVPSGEVSRRVCAHAPNWLWESTHRCRAR